MFVLQGAALRTAFLTALTPGSGLPSLQPRFIISGVPPVNGACNGIPDAVEPPCASAVQQNQPDQQTDEGEQKEEPFWDQSQSQLVFSQLGGVFVVGVTNGLFRDPAGGKIAENIPAI